MTGVELNQGQNAMYVSEQTADVEGLCPKSHLNSLQKCTTFDQGPLDAYIGSPLGQIKTRLNT